MSSPPEGGVSTLGTINIAQVVLSDEEEYYNRTDNQKEVDMTVEDGHVENSNNTGKTSRSGEILAGAKGKNSQSKLFNLSTDKYNTSNIYVYIEKTNDQHIGRLHPLLVGHILHKKLFVKNIIAIKSSGKNRIKVQVKSAKDANDLVNNKLLESENLRAFIPNHILEKKGLIRGVDTFFDTDYLKENIISDYKVFDIYRMQRKVERDNKIVSISKQTVVITFEGNVLPNEIEINSVIFPVEPFVGRVTQCFKCLRYGHISGQCRATNTLCINCGKTKLDDHTCLEVESYCIHCKTGGHKSNSRDCPFYEEQKKIKKVMAENNFTFIEAKEYCKNSFSNCVTSNRFSVLSNDNYESNFPKLPTNKTYLSQPCQQNSFTNNRNTVTFSQPSTSHRNDSSSKNKKRKIAPSSPNCSTPPPMFPFKFGASSHGTMNANTPMYHLETQKSKILESVSCCFFEFVQKIKTLEDIKKFDIESIKRQINMVLEDTFSNKLHSQI